MSDIRPHVQKLIDQGFAVVPLDPGSKGLERKGWLKHAIGLQKDGTYQHGFHLEDFKAESNVGVIPGPCSGNRINVDLDSEMAVKVAGEILPETGVIHGRPGKPRSHFWYNVPPGVKPMKFIDPVVNSMLLEVQVENGQTVMPPSTHPSGECYEYYGEGTPTALTQEKFVNACTYAAITTLLATYWPRTPGNRHDLAMCTTGFLAQHIPHVDVLTGMLEVVFKYGGDEEVRDRMIAVRTSLASLAVDNKTTGEPTFREKFPQGPLIADAILKWLNVERSKGKKRQGPPPTEKFKAEQFVAFLPDHTYMLLDNFQVWASAAILQHVKSPDKDLNACEWLDRENHVEELTWSPGRPLKLKDTLVISTGERHNPGMTTLNLYVEPLRRPGDVNKAARWIDHVCTLYPQEAGHIIGWMAWRVQHPEVKINHALVLGGTPGIGKDSILVPLNEALGSWNFETVSPDQLMGRFNGFLKSVVLRVNEARDLGDANRYQLYERCKWYLASPPEYFRVDEKNLREHPVKNIVGVVFTTNHKEGGLYLPDDDRRHYVAWSELTSADLPSNYFEDLYAWYRDGGSVHVAEFLRMPELLSGFDPAAPPPKTEAWHQIVGANRSPEEAEIAGVLDRLKAPDAVTVQDVIDACLDGEDQSLVDLGEWLKDRKNARSVPHRMDSLGYTSVRNPSDKRGYWKIHGHQVAIYVKRELSAVNRLAAARKRQGDKGDEGDGPSSPGNKFSF